MYMFEIYINFGGFKIINHMFRNTCTDSCRRSTEIIPYTDTRRRTLAHARPDPVEFLVAKRGAAGAVSFERHHVLNAAPFQTICEHLGTQPL